MANTLELQPVEMTADVMQMLEDKELIIRLCPGKHELPVKPGEAADKSIYVSDPQYGPHKLITVTIDDPNLGEFGTHPDNEEFLFIGDPDTKPLYLLISLHRRAELLNRIKTKQLTADDFVCLRITYNDPYVSFFTMLKDVPHGELTADVDGKPASFYVTESRDIQTEMISFGDFSIKLKK